MNDLLSIADKQGLNLVKLIIKEITINLVSDLLLQSFESTLNVIHLRLY